MIEAQALEKSFRTKTGVMKAVDGVSFVARDGEITGLLGPNGAGKTTTLRMLYTLMTPDRGSVRVDGKDGRDDDARKALGVLPDARGIYKRWSARENVEYFARLQGVPEALAHTRLQKLAQALQMDSILERRAEGFSQGERTKTAIARALIHDPRNVILDEPTNGLDVMTTRALRTFIRGLKAEGRCVLFSSHIMQEVVALCDRIIVIAKGRVVAEGTTEELRARTGEAQLEDAFVKLIGSGEGLS
jgi:sodium transport system ATP-binding protein